jgi:hypothetical protein
MGHQSNPHGSTADVYGAPENPHGARGHIGRSASCCEYSSTPLTSEGGLVVHIHDVALLHNHYYGPVSRVLQLLSLTMIHDHAEKARTTHAEPRYYFLTFLPLPHLSLIEDGPVRLCDLLCMSVDLFAQSSLFRLFVLFLFSCLFA